MEETEQHVVLAYLAFDRAVGHFKFVTRFPTAQVSALYVSSQNGFSPVVLQLVDAKADLEVMMMLRTMDYVVYLIVMQRSSFGINERAHAKLSLARAFARSSPASFSAPPFLSFSQSE